MEKELLDLNLNFFAAGIVPEHNYRFVLADCTAPARSAAVLHDASASLGALMGEVMLGAFFLSLHAGKEDDITCSIHLECDGPAKRVIAFAKDTGALRGWPVDAHAEWNGSANDGMGSGVLQVNRWKGSNKTYSSLVELRKTSLEKNLEEFIGRSEQLQSFIRIDSKNAGIIQRVSGYLFQALPGASADDADAVLEIMRNKDADLLTAHPDQSDLRAAIPGRVLRTGQFHLFCDCSREKIQQALISMGRESLEELTIEQGFIEVHCEFCRKRYEFTGKDIEDLFIT